MRSCLVTGASGLIGSHVVRALAPSWKIFALSRQAIPGLPPEQHLPVDLARPWADGALPASIDAIVHLAQAERYREFPDAALEVFRVNTESTLHLLEWGRRAGAKKLILASTGSLYPPSDAVITEDAPLQEGGPLGLYLASKRAAELFASAYRSLLDVDVLRFFFVYGPGQNRNMLLPRLVRSVREGTPITLQGSDGLHLRPLHAEDAARAIGKLLDRAGSDTYNVAGPEVLTLRAVSETIGRALGMTPKLSVDANAKPASLVADIARISRVAGAPQIRLADGIASWLATGAEELS